MTSGVNTIIYPVTDLAKAKALYGEWLGVEPSADAPYYVGFDVDGQHIGLNPQGHAQGATGPVGFVDVDDINKSLDALLNAGAELKQAVKNVGGGLLVASVQDADGNVIGLRQAT